MESFRIDPARTRDIAPLLLDACGRVRVVPASVLQATTSAERMLFGVRYGVYSFPTTELVAFLRERIAGRRAIEVGAGHGVLAQSLGIPATDNRQQEEPEVAAYYRSIRQPVIRYGDDVEKLDAAAAIAKYRPEVVVACWVTHRFDPQHPAREGSVTGVDEVAVVRACEEYVFIGNSYVHRHKPLWTMAHERLEPSWLYSRAINGTADFIAIWRRSALQTS